MLCQAGIARTSIRMGNISRARKILRKIEDKNLIIELAYVCENSKQMLDAAQLYERSDQFEKATSMYIQLKMFKEAPNSPKCWKNY